MEVLSRRENKMKNNKYFTFGTVLKSNRKMTERDQINTINKQIHDSSLSLFGTDISIKKK